MPKTDPTEQAVMVRYQNQPGAFLCRGCVNPFCELQSADTYAAGWKTGEEAECR